MARKKKSSGVRVDLSNVGSAFSPNEEYEVACEECTLEDGQKAPYFKLKLRGVGDHSNSVMYHNASTSDESLWRLRPLLEAFGIEIPDGPMDLEADDFVGKHAMCSTFKDTYAGGSSIKPDEFWPVEGARSSNGGEIDLDEIDDGDIQKIAKELGIKGRKPDQLREKLAELEDDEIREAAEEAGVDLGEEEEEEKPKKGGKKEPKRTITSEAIAEMNEDELEELIEEHDLKVDLGEFRTLRKKRNAVIDAAEEAGVIE
jgi:hypothetical protein